MNVAFFTTPDPDLTQESSVDPMGIQTIWTYFGQVIFGEKLTTVANDLRAFTFNIFHHHLIQRLLFEHSDFVSAARQKYSRWNTEMDIKTGLLIFLEDLVTWSFYDAKASGETQFETMGILGMSKARIEANSTQRNTQLLSAYKKDGLLKNQLNLGMTGRYKGPMMKMGFFNRNFEVNAAQSQEWQKVTKLISGWENAIKLQDILLDFLVKELLIINSKDNPKITLTDLKKSKYWKKIRKGYLDCFGSVKPVKEIQNYWKDKLGLLSGASAALYSVIENMPPGQLIKHELTFREALKKLKEEPEEAQKIENIIFIEPFLSHSEYLIRFLSQKEVKNIFEHKDDLQKLQGAILKSSKFHVSNNSEQLNFLRNIMVSNDDVLTWLQNILAYHKSIMEKRGGSAWISLDNKGNLKHYFGPSLSSAIRSIKEYLKIQPWLHTYYLETLRSIHIGLE